LQGPTGQIIPGTDFNPFQYLLPQAKTVENLAYGNLPVEMPYSGTGGYIPVVKTNRGEELADLVATFGALPGAAKAVSSGANKIGDLLTQAVTRNPEATSLRALSEIDRMSPFPQITVEPKTSKFEMPSFASLKPETTDDIDKIYDYLEKQAKKSGFRVESGASNVSNSRYLTIEKDLGNDEISTIEVRISAHGDRHPFTYATDGKISIDPSRGGVDLETTLWDLQEKGYDLIK